MPVYNVMPIDPSPVYPIEHRPDFAVNEAKFGDGYVLEVEAGMNAKTDNLSIRWERLYRSEYATILAFLEAHAPTIPFVVPSSLSGTGGLYTCKSFTHSQTDVGLFTITATLIQNHG